MDITTRHIKYQADCDRAFAAEIKAVPGCETLDSCIQCGTCSGACPMSSKMDMTPRQIINLVRYGFKREVMQSNSFWLCSSCYACTVECPREIHVTDVMYALKRKAMREKRHPRRFPAVVLAREFYNIVRNHGRLNEIHLVSRLFLGTNPLKGLSMTRVGIELLRRGRISLMPENIRQRAQLRSLLDDPKHKPEPAHHPKEVRPL